MLCQVYLTSLLCIHVRTQQESQWAWKINKIDGVSSATTASYIGMYTCSTILYYLSWKHGCKIHTRTHQNCSSIAVGFANCYQREGHDQQDKPREDN